jgi:catalase (peroxidase I)
LASKIFESYVLDWLKDKVTIKSNQFGGVKGTSVEHLLCGIWHEIAINQEDNRSATVQTAIDYAKAFNRLDYKACLDSLAAKRASSQVLGLVATFLTNR